MTSNYKTPFVCALYGFYSRGRRFTPEVELLLEEENKKSTREKGTENTYKPDNLTGAVSVDIMPFCN